MALPVERKLHKGVHDQITQGQANGSTIKALSEAGSCHRGKAMPT